MKTLLLLPFVSLTLLGASVRAEEPVRSNLTPELQALLADLLKQADAEADPAPIPAPTPAAPAAPAAPLTAAAPARPPLGSASNLRTGALQTGSLGVTTLTGASLAPSGSVGGRGQTGAPRLSKEEWRVLFPVAPERR